MSDGIQFVPGGEVHFELFAVIREDSKYRYQQKKDAVGNPIPFPVEVKPHGDPSYSVIGGPGGCYRLCDVDLFGKERYWHDKATPEFERLQIHPAGAKISLNWVLADYREVAEREEKLHRKGEHSGEKSLEYLTGYLDALESMLHKMQLDAEPLAELAREIEGRIRDLARDRKEDF